MREYSNIQYKPIYRKILKNKMKYKLERVEENVYSITYIH